MLEIFPEIFSFEIWTFSYEDLVKSIIQVGLKIDFIVMIEYIRSPGKTEYRIFWLSADFENNFHFLIKYEFFF